MRAGEDTTSFKRGDPFRARGRRLPRTFGARLLHLFKRFREEPARHNTYGDWPALPSDLKTNFHASHYTAEGQQDHA